MKPGYVVWHDAHSSDEWKDIPKEYESCEVVTVGYIKEHPAGIVVIGNYIKDQPTHDEMCFGVTQIPRGCVKTIRYFEGFEY